jgi:anti-sigma B factor antagonist
VDISVSTGGRVTTARLAGEVDTYTVPEVRTAFDQLDVVADGKVVVDLRDVTFMDSSGLGAVIGLYHRVTDAGARLQLVCGGVTLRLVRMMNLDQVIEVVEEPDDERPSATATEPATPA